MLYYANTNRFAELYQKYKHQFLLLSSDVLDSWCPIYIQCFHYTENSQLIYFSH